MKTERVFDATGIVTFLACAAITLIFDNVILRLRIKQLKNRDRLGKIVEDIGAAMDKLEKKDPEPERIAKA